MSTVLSRPLVRWSVAGVLGLTVAGIANGLLAKRANRIRPPLGRFIRVHGETLHYLDRGKGKTLVLLHGNGSAVEDFAVSGLVQQCAADNRVIAFDRPGFGHSSRTTRRQRHPEEQADLIAAALRELGIRRAVIFGHSWGALVALAIALRHPDLVASLVLASGYYFPVPRPDIVLFSLPGIPLVGDVLSYTVWPLAARFNWKLAMNRLFAPAPVSEKLSTTLRPLSLRPGTVRSTGEDTAAMFSAAKRLSSEYHRIRTPVTVLAGAGDRIVSTRQARRLQSAIRIGSLHLIPAAGHMVHHSAVDDVAAAIRRSMIHAA